MAKKQQKEQALKLRSAGVSIGDIANRLSISKSTASYWCRNIQLSPSQIKKLYEKQKRAAMASITILAEKNRRKRIATTKEMTIRGNIDVGRITKRDLFIIGLALYWGEGYKKGSQEFGFTNSDPEIVKVFIRWVNDIYCIDKNQLILRVSINSIHKNREQDVLKYWAHVTKTPLSQFTKTSFIKTKAKKQYANHNKHYGTLRIKVRRGTNLRRRVLGSISAIANSINC